MRKALFLDRDGVINQDLKYVHKIEDFVFNSDIFKICKFFLDREYLIFVITNQAGIARGYYSLDDFKILDSFMIKEFKKRDITVTKTYFCPHHPDFTKECECRKPKPKMLFDAESEFDLDLKNSVLIGDKPSDIEAGVNANLKYNFLVKSVYDLKDEHFNSLNDLFKFLKDRDDSF